MPTGLYLPTRKMGLLHRGLVLLKSEGRGFVQGHGCKAFLCDKVGGMLIINIINANLENLRLIQLCCTPL